MFFAVFLIRRVCLWAFWIRVRIRNLFVRIRILILPSTSKKIEANLYLYSCVTSLWIFIFEKWCNIPWKRNKNKNLEKKNYFLLVSWRWLTKKAGSGSASGSGSICQRYGSASGFVPKCHGSGTLVFLLNICFLEMMYLFWRNNNLDDLADSFAGAFNVTNTPNDTNRWTVHGLCPFFMKLPALKRYWYRSIRFSSKLK
jgi:hypothetical protein